MIEKIDINNKNRWYINTQNILEIIVIFYCLVFFRHLLSNNVLQILNYKLEKNIINSILLSSDQKCNTQGITSYYKRNISKIKEKNSENSKTKDLNLFNIWSIFNVSFKFDIVTQINIINIYIIDIIFYIVYYIYSKSRKKEENLNKVLNNYGCSNLCIT